MITHAIKTDILDIRDNVSFYFYHGGQGNMTLLFLHGWCINATYWIDQLNHFGESYNVYAPDIPGFGKSNAKRDEWSIEEYTNDILAFISKLGLNNVIMVGHSMSGDIMVETALRSPNKRIIGLVGVDNFKFVDFPFHKEQMDEMNNHFEMLVSDFSMAAPNYADQFLFDQSTTEKIKNMVKSDFATADQSVGISSLTHHMTYNFKIGSKLEQLRQKLYLINSDTVPTYEASLLDRCKNGYQIFSMGKTGHYPMIENPELFNHNLDLILKNF